MTCIFSKAIQASFWAVILLLGHSQARAQCAGNGPDGIVGPAEACDDNNSITGDGCNAQCQTETGFVCPSIPNFSTITPENYPGKDDGAVWDVSENGFVATQTINSNATVGFFGADSTAAAYVFDLNVTDNDDDFIGFVLGWNPGDTANTNADFLLVDWKKRNQNLGQIGLAVSRVQGIPDQSGNIANTELWTHQGAVTELQRATNLGNTGWTSGTTYRFVIRYSPNRIEISVDGTVELDLTAAVGTSFPLGQVGFYGLSQKNVTYRVIGVLGDSCSFASDPAMADSDQDGIPDQIEAGGLDPAADHDGDGEPDFRDSDAPDFVDNNGDGIDDRFDTDGDGTPNHLDLDSDGDGLFDLHEAGGLSLDSDNDGRIDGFTDADNDGVHDALAMAPLSPPDSDGDGNPNFLDPDDDGDGIATALEAADTDSNGNPSDARDTDGNGVPDYLDPDDDGDGVPTALEMSDPSGDGNPNDARDTDGNGVPDYLDPDDDGDGIPTQDERPNGQDIDINGNGIADHLENADSFAGFMLSGGALCSLQSGQGSHAVHLLWWLALALLSPALWRRRRSETGVD